MWSIIQLGWPHRTLVNYEEYKSISLKSFFSKTKTCLNPDSGWKTRWSSSLQYFVICGGPSVLVHGVDAGHSLCLNFSHLFVLKPNLETISIYSNKFFHNFHLSLSSFTCPRLWTSGLARRLESGQPKDYEIDWYLLLFCRIGSI